MLRAECCVLLVLITTAGGCGERAEPAAVWPAPTPAERELLRVDAMWWQVRNGGGDVAALDALLSGEYVDATHLGNVTTRAQALNGQRRANARPLPYRLAESVAIVRGDVGIVVHQVRLEQDDRQYEERWFHTWRRENGRWRLFVRTAAH